MIYYVKMTGVIEKGIIISQREIRIYRKIFLRAKGTVPSSPTPKFLPFNILNVL